MINFENQVALITGARRGIGFAIARTLGRYGAKVVVCDVASENDMKAALDVLHSEGIEVMAHIADVTQRPEIETLVEKVLESWGRIDILVNNAGITRDANFIWLKDEDWTRVLDVCLQGSYNCTKSVIKPMLKRRYGRIINISSVVGVTGNTSQVNYSTAKAALLGFTKSLAREFASRGITVNAIAPGFIDTEMTRVLPEEVRKGWLVQIPVGRLGQPEDVSEMVAFLASQAAGYITGQTFHVNGGMLMI